jgi:hypothetical protein
MGSKEALYKIAEKLTAISKTIKFSITPLNAAAEQKKFFARKYKYNPQFEYKKFVLPAQIIGDLSRVEEEIRNASFPSAIETACLETTNFLENLYYSSISVGKQEFSRNVNKLHNWEHKTEGDYTEFLSLKIDHDSESWDAEMIQREFIDHIQSKGLNGWAVEINTDRKNVIFVSPSKKTVSIGSSITRNKQDVKRLALHEIDTHVYRNEQKSKVLGPLRIFTKRSDSHLLEEGLAVFNEFSKKMTTNRARKVYALRLLGAQNAHLSFAEIFDLLRSHNLSALTAYITAVRLKRGLGDTSLAGGFIKDSAYLVGYERVKANPDLSEHLFIGSPDFIEQLRLM